MHQAFIEIGLLGHCFRWSVRSRLSFVWVLYVLFELLKVASFDVIQMHIFIGRYRSGKFYGFLAKRLSDKKIGTICSIPTSKQSTHHLIIWQIKTWESGKNSFGFGKILENLVARHSNKFLLLDKQITANTINPFIIRPFRVHTHEVKLLG